MSSTHRRRAAALFAAGLCGAALLLVPSTAHAYVGPGAGIAFATTAFALLVSMVLAAVGLLLYPVRMLWRLARRRRPPRPPRIRRAVLIGLDGLDPELTRRFMSEGKLPNMEKLAKAGCFHRLGTTYPAMSPVAWSSFATGTSPAKHGIFDFITRDPRTYKPDLSSAEVRPPRRHLPIGPYRIPLGKPEVKLPRRSKPLREALGRHAVPSSGLRVPIPLPAEPFAAATLLPAASAPAPADRPVPHPARQAGGQAPAPVQAVLGGARPPRRAVVGPAGADHLPGRAVRRRHAAVGDVRAGSRRHPGHLHPLHLGAGRVGQLRRRQRRRDRRGRPAGGDQGRGRPGRHLDRGAAQPAAPRR